MPTYDYRCTACDREVEVMHGISESGPQTCEHCGGAMRKALSSPAIHFKGSGWAKKDAASAKKPKPTASDTGGTPSAKTDDKAATADSSTSSADSSTGSGETKSTATSTAGSKTD